MTTLFPGKFGSVPIRFTMGESSSTAWASTELCGSTFSAVGVEGCPRTSWEASTECKDVSPRGSAHQGGKPLSNRALSSSRLLTSAAARRSSVGLSKFGKHSLPPKLIEAPISTLIDLFLFNALTLYLLGCRLLLAGMKGLRLVGRNEEIE